jgi:pimeloyl-ACP methyl ester carboxylesterase
LCLCLRLATLASTATAQVGKWLKLTQTSSDADFTQHLQPARYGLAIPQTQALRAWQQDASVGGDSLFALLSAWNTYPKPRQTGVICRYEVRLDSTHTAPYLVYVPKNYDYRRPTKLLVYYKGGWLNRKELPANYAKEIVVDNPTFPYLDEQNIIEIYPCLRQDLAIYGNYGFQHLTQMVVQTKRLFNIDDNQVYLSGFSDGGKTVFHVASLLPSLFAGFYVINGGLASRPEFLTLRARPLLAFVAQADELISPKSVPAYAAEARRLGADWQVRLLPGRKHYYAPYQRAVLPNLFRQLRSQSRQPLPTRLVYARGFNLRELTGLDWLQQVVSTTKQPTASHQTDSVRVANMAGEPSRYQVGATAGQVRATCFNNTYTVETSLVDEVVLYLSPVLVDLTQPVRVVINGQERFNGRMVASKEFMLHQFRANMDRQQLFVNELRFKL